VMQHLVLGQVDDIVQLAVIQYIIPSFYGSSRDKDIDRFQISIESVHKVKVSQVVQLAVIQHPTKSMI